MVIDKVTYSEEEEKAMKELFSLIEGDEQTKMWAKFAQKQFLIAGLRPFNLDHTLAFKMFKDFHTLTTKTYPDFFGMADATLLPPIVEKKIFQIVKRANDEGPAIMVMRYGNWHMSDATIEEVFCVGLLYLWTVAKESTEIQKNGVICIGDMSGFKLKHARQLTIDLVKMAVKFYSTMPMGIKGVVGFYSHTLVEETYNLFKGVLPKELRSLIHITKDDTEVIAKLVPNKNCLPVEFGGTIPNVEAYQEDIEAQILKDKELLELMKKVQDEICQVNGIKRKEKKKEKKDKKNKSKEADAGKIAVKA